MGADRGGRRVRGVAAGVLALVLAAAVFAAGAGTEARRPAARKAPKPPAEEAEVRAVVEQFLEALNTCDLEKTMALFAPGATAFSPLRDKPLRAEGCGDVEAVFRELYDNVRRELPGPRYLNLTADQLKIQLSGTAAVATFQIVSGPATSRRSLVLTNEGGRWLILHLHASNMRSDQPGPQQE